MPSASAPTPPQRLCKLTPHNHLPTMESHNQALLSSFQRKERRNDPVRTFFPISFFFLFPNPFLLLDPQSTTLSTVRRLRSTAHRIPLLVNAPRCADRHRISLCVMDIWKDKNAHQVRECRYVDTFSNDDFSNPQFYLSIALPRLHVQARRRHLLLLAACSLSSRR